jgi:hypothetical protein
LRDKRSVVPRDRRGVAQLFSLGSIARMKICTPLLAFALLCGCAHQRFVAGHSDVGQFILQTAVQFGGVPATTNGLPPISDQWRYSEDSGGIIINLTHQDFPAVESFLHQSFGQPAGGHDGKNGYYRLTTNGGSIYFTDADHATQVIILRSHPNK